METTFYVGQRVRVTNNKKTYSTHREAFERFGFKDKNVNLSFQNGTEANVFAVDIVNGNDLSVGIRDSHGNESLISVTGITPIDPRVVLTEWQKQKLKDHFLLGYKYASEGMDWYSLADDNLAQIESILSSPEPPKYQPKPTIEELQMRIELLENKFAALK